jgi:hypothetical protein
MSESAKMGMSMKCTFGPIVRIGTVTAPNDCVPVYVKAGVWDITVSLDGSTIIALHEDTEWWHGGTLWESLLDVVNFVSTLGIIDEQLITKSNRTRRYIPSRWEQLISAATLNVVRAGIVAGLTDSTGTYGLTTFISPCAGTASVAGIFDTYNLASALWITVD